MVRREDGARVLVICVAGVLVLPPLPTIVRIVPAILLTLYLPGSALIAASIRCKLSTPEALGISAALSLGCCVLSALALNYLHALNGPGWAIALTGISLSGTAAASLSGRRFRPISHQIEAFSMRRRTVAALAAAALLAVGSVMLAAKGAMSQREFHYTDFWMVPASSTPSLATVGVRNEEGRATRYAIEILSRGALSDVPLAFELAPGASQTFTIALPTVVLSPPKKGGPDGDGGEIKNTLPQRVEARLYKDGDRSVIYRNVWVAVPDVVQLTSPIFGPVGGSELQLRDAKSRPVPFARSELASHMQSLPPQDDLPAAFRDQIKTRQAD